MSTPLGVDPPHAVAAPVAGSDKRFPVRCRGEAIRWAKIALD